MGAWWRYNFHFRNYLSEVFSPIEWLKSLSTDIVALAGFTSVYPVALLLLLAKTIHPMRSVQICLFISDAQVTCPIVLWFHRKN